MVRNREDFESGILARYSEQNPTVAMTAPASARSAYPPERKKLKLAP